MSARILGPGERPAPEARMAKNARHRGRAARAKWEDAERQFGEFLRTGARLGEGLEATSERLRGAYLTWAAVRGEAPMSAQAFRVRGRRAFAHTAEKNRPTTYFGVAPGSGETGPPVSARRKNAASPPEGPLFPCQRAPHL